MNPYLERDWADLHVQVFIDRCYELGGYWQGDCREDPVPPLLPDELEWLDGCLRAAGLRE